MKTKIKIRPVGLHHGIVAELWIGRKLVKTTRLFPCGAARAALETAK